MKALLNSVEVKYPGVMFVTFQIDPKGFQFSTERKAYELTIQEYSPERNADQNAKYWSIVGEIAKIMGVSKTVIHNQLLYDYGELDLKDGNPIEVMMPESYDYLSDRDLHLAPTGDTEMIDGKMYVKYYKLVDSKHLTKKQFSRLMDGAIAERNEL